MLLQGSCHYQRVRFRVRCPHPHPFLLCYCSICRKTEGGGGLRITTREYDRVCAVRILIIGRESDFLE